MKSRRFQVLGVGIDPTNMPDMVGRLRTAVHENAKVSLVFCTVSSILEARRDPLVIEAISSASYVLPDGMPLVWLGKRMGHRGISRVYGPDFMLAVFSQQELNFRHYFYGGAPGVAHEMAEGLKANFPGLLTAGVRSPPQDLSPMDVRMQDIERINEAKPDIVWVGLGHPKQELWMRTNRDRLQAPVLAGVGAAFDFLSGRKREAPEWMKRSGLQWLHRLISEPRRLWRRYLVGNTVFIALLLRERLFGRKELPRD